MSTAANRKKVKFVAGISVIVLCMLYLVVSGFQKTAIYYFTVSELEARETEFVGQRIKLAGKVVPGSIRSVEGQRVIEFEIWEPSDEQQVSQVSLSGKRLIRYHGIVPDTFKDEADVVLEGVTGQDGMFVADTLLAKCPSKYEGKSYDEMKDAHGGSDRT
jgi:cytochrome c-type biogenesis protein CcmE